VSLFNLRVCFIYQRDCIFPFLCSQRVSRPYLREPLLASWSDMLSVRCLWLLMYISCISSGTGWAWCCWVSSSLLLLCDCNDHI